MSWYAELCQADIADRKIPKRYRKRVTKAHNQPRTNRRTHPPAPTNPLSNRPRDPPTNHVLQQFSNTLQQLMGIQLVRSPPSSSRESIMGVQKRKLQNTATTLNFEPGRPPPQPPIQPPTFTHQLTQPRRTTAIHTYSITCVGTRRIDPSVVLGFPLFHHSPPSRGVSDPSPGGRLSTPPAR